MKKRGKNGVLYWRNLQRKTDLNEKAVQQQLGQILKEADLPLRRVGIILVSDRRIAGYNHRYLGRRRPTDVLSFSLGPAEGEVLISAETAARQAREYGHSLEEEILILAIHGILHLCGYDDQTEDDRGMMEAETERLRRLSTA